ncbi:hypothetical protein Cni_G20055 [Canna indica]|uniref:Uncharacterized protein n=1 Tax=Canna indica TaxID=4628 RepID=A0AAQ3QJ64_9LILI|nr:hypothetical protein Cni_G20055 [Canna indica]
MCASIREILHGTTLLPEPMQLLFDFAYDQLLAYLALASGVAGATTARGLSGGRRRHEGRAGASLRSRLCPACRRTSQWPWASPASRSLPSPPSSPEEPSAIVILHVQSPPSIAAGLNPGAIAFGGPGMSSYILKSLACTSSGRMSFFRDGYS